MSTDQTVMAFLDALDAATAASAPESRLAAGRRALAALASVLPQRGGNRRGPKAKHDRTWADNRLLEFAIEDPDGLPDSQTKFVDRLRAAFEKRGGHVPKNTWLFGVVREFYDQAEAQDRELSEKYRNSPEMIPLFPSAKDFIFYTRMTARLEERWKRDKALQNKHSTATAFIESLTNLKPEIELKIGAELAKSSGILPRKILK